MENELNIKVAVEDLANLIGLKAPIKTRVLKRKIKRGKIESILPLLTLQFGLPLKLKLKWEDNLPEPATVQLPSNLPLFGSPRLQDISITIRVQSKFCNDSNVLPLLLSHEIAHILLHTLNYQHKKSEKYTDLAAVMMGFQNIYRNARKTIYEKVTYSGCILFPSSVSSRSEITTTEFGYLSDNEFRIALDETDSFLAIERYYSKKLNKALLEFSKNLTSFYNKLEKFKQIHEYLNSHRNIKISKKDGIQVTNLFFSNTLIELEEYYQSENRVLKANSYSFNKVIHYFPKKSQEMIRKTEAVESHCQRLKLRLVQLERDLKVLNKYMPLFRLPTKK